VELLPPGGVAVDLCTGTGAIARTLLRTGERTETRVLATDLDERAVACARANGVVAVVPYMPTPALALLQRDTLTFESPLSYDGGADGTDILRRVLTESPRFLRPGGTVLVELGGEEADALSGDLARLGYVDVAVLRDDDDDIRGLEATWSS
jgi:release factor glutamine methyltransferase